MFRIRQLSLLKHSLDLSKRYTGLLLDISCSHHVLCSVLESIALQWSGFRWHLNVEGHCHPCAGGMALLVRLYKDTVITPAARDCGSPISTVSSVMISHYHLLSPPSPAHPAQPSPAQPSPAAVTRTMGDKSCAGLGDAANHIDYLRRQGHSRVTQIKESNPLLHLYSIDMNMNMNAASYRCECEI